MTWSWKLARIAGIDVHMHATFLMLAPAASDTTLTLPALTGAACTTDR